MKKLIYIIFAIACVSCSNSTREKLLGTYSINDNDYELKFALYEDSTFMLQTTAKVKKYVGSLQFNGKWSVSNDSILLREQYRCVDGNNSESNDTTVYRIIQLKDNKLIIRAQNNSIMEWTRED